MARLLFHPLAWLLGARIADAILGDLEELRRRRAARSGLAAWIWFLRAALGILLHALGARLRDALTGASASAGGTRGVGGDLHHALRTLGRRPGFSLAVVFLLALGIGANTAVYSVVHAVMLRPLPYQNPDRLAFIWKGTETRPDNTHSIMTGTHVIEIAEHQKTLASYAVFKHRDIGLDGAIDLLLPDGTERLTGAHVTPNFFELLGVGAALGRTFASSDTEAVPAVVISDALWRRRFGGDPSIVGSHISLASGRGSRTGPAYTVLGVLPPEFRFTYPEETAVYVAMPWTHIRRSRALEYAMVARLAPGVSPAQSAAELTAVAHNVMRGYGIPEPHLSRMLQREAVLVEPIAEHMVAEVKPGLTVLASVAALVLVIACVNIGLLMMSRTIDRTRELAVRASLGAGPARLVRLMLVEGTVLAAAGATAGVALAYLALPAVRSLMPPVVPRIDEIGIDARVLLFAIGVGVVCALICGITPALIALRGDLLGHVRRAAPTTTVGRRLSMIRMCVVGVQVAVVLVLLVGAGLLLHSFWRLQSAPLGFAADDVLTVEMRLLNPRYRQKGSTAAFERQLLDSIRSLPGVASAALSTAVPMRGVDFVGNVQLPDKRRKSGSWRAVDPAYFSIMRIPLVAGRTFNEHDRAGSRLVVVVSESMAERLFGAQPAVGREILIEESKPAEIIGVVGDVRYAEVERRAAPAYYTPRAQTPVELICVLVKPEPGMREHVAVSLREAVRRLDAQQPVEGLTTIGDIVQDATADRRFYALATGAFAAVALLLAVGGLFGVISRSVSERRRELAIRVALGADSTRVVRLVVAFGLLPVAFGCLAGIATAMTASRALEALVYEIPATDPATYAAAVALVLCVGVAASIGPAARAVRLQPMAALKND